MPHGELAIERREEPLFLGALVGALVHLGVDVVDHPVRRNAHVTSERPAVDEHDAELPELSVCGTIVDEIGDEERLAGHAGEVRRKAVRIVESRSRSLPPCESTGAAMIGETPSVEHRSSARSPLHDVRQRLACDGHGRRHDRTRDGVEELRRLIPDDAGNPAGRIDDRLRRRLRRSASWRSNTWLSLDSPIATKTTSCSGSGLGSGWPAARTAASPRRPSPRAGSRPACWTSCRRAPSGPGAEVSDARAESDG